jgi:hypothetical protein
MSAAKRRNGGPRSRAISYRDARECENATTPRHVCECRCGGAAHGAARGRPEDLPLDDPHSARPRSGTCRICGCTERHPCAGAAAGRVCEWLDKGHTFCAAHTRGELQAWGFYLGPPFPGSVLRGDVPTRGQLQADADARWLDEVDELDGSPDPRQLGLVLDDGAGDP